jgi:hypothetical protein
MPTETVTSDKVNDLCLTGPGNFRAGPSKFDWEADLKDKGTGLFPPPI